MSVTVTNVAETFLGFWELAKDKPVSEQALLWETHYAEPHRAVLDFYQEHYNDLNAPPEEVFARYPHVIPTIRTASAKAETVIAEAVKKCAATLGVAETQGHHIVMVGQFSSNAWADVFGGVPTCFYALELIPDADTLALMAVHETAHTLHRGVSDVPLEGATAAEKLLLEGLATLTSAVVVPGLGDEAYLWPGYTTTTEGQGVTAWLERCVAQESELQDQLLHDLDSDDPKVLGRYFNTGAKYRHDLTPTRAGYAVGLWLLRRLHRRFELGEMARWNRKRIRREIAEVLLTWFLPLKP